LKTRHPLVPRPLRRTERENMKRTALALALLAIASNAFAVGIAGTVLTTGGQPVFPCVIDVTDRQTGQPVNVANNNTLANGTYNLVLPTGRYNLLFKPPIGSHIFQGTFQDARPNNNVVTVNMSLPTGHYLAGRVVTTLGAGVGLTDIRFKDATGALVGEVQDNGSLADGTFNTLVVPGLYTAEIIPPIANHKVPREMLNQNLNADINLGNVVVQDGFILTCTVTDASLFPYSGARLTVRTLPGHDKFFTPFNNTSGTGVVQVVVPPGVFDVIALPPPALEGTVATVTQYSWNAAADATLPNFALPPGKHLTAHVVGGSPAASVVNADIDVEQMLAPTFPRVETPNDFTDAVGNFTVTVAQGTYRVTINPPVATKLLPLRAENVSVGPVGTNMGTLSCLTGHWIDVHVVEAGTGLPVGGANIDLINLQTGDRLITIDDVTAANGFTRIVSDNALYHVKISPPNTNYDTAYVAGAFRTTQDTVITVVMPKHGTLGVGTPQPGALELASPWPNPARGAVRFAFAGHGEGELSIVDVSGRLVATPWRGTLDGGSAAGWEGRDGAGHVVPNGVYFAILRVDGGRSVRRVVIAN
jgi:hypothetical protein